MAPMAASGGASGGRRPHSVGGRTAWTARPPTSTHVLLVCAGQLASCYCLPQAASAICCRLGRGCKPKLRRLHLSLTLPVPCTLRTCSPWLPCPHSPLWAPTPRVGLSSSPRWAAITCPPNPTTPRLPAHASQPASDRPAAHQLPVAPPRRRPSLRQRQGGQVPVGQGPDRQQQDRRWRGEAVGRVGGMTARSRVWPCGHPQPPHPTQGRPLIAAPAASPLGFGRRR